jgi:hypothetical protein
MNRDSLIIPYADNEKCIEIGKVLANFHLNASFLQRPFLHQQADDETIARACYFAVAICHQTHQLFNTDLNLHGWDYLEHVFTALSGQKSILLDPCYIVREDRNILKKKLEDLFPRSGQNSGTSLDRTDERTDILQEAAGFISTQYGNNILRLLHSTEGRLFNNGTGFYEQLATTSVFADPLFKKSTFLIKLLTDCNLYHIRDTENILPIMDYHMQRVLLRTGAVAIPDAKLASDLRNRVFAGSDQPVRNACVEAMKMIARTSGHSILAMNDIFWPLGRSCCQTKPLCISGICEKKPCSLTANLLLDQHTNCIFETVCKGATNPLYRDFWQPEVITHFY